MKTLDQKYRELESITDMGIYPQAVRGCKDESNYEQRDGFKNGWNEAVMTFMIKARNIIFGEEREESWTEPEKLFNAVGDSVFDLHENVWWVSLNDTWYWGCADGEEIPREEYSVVADLFRAYGTGGVYWWVAQKRGHPSEFSPEKEMIAHVGEMKALSEKLREQKVYKKENLKTNT